MESLKACHLFCWRIFGWHCQTDQRLWLNSITAVITSVWYASMLLSGLVVNKAKSQSKTPARYQGTYSCFLLSFSHSMSGQGLRPKSDSHVCRLGRIAQQDLTYALITRPRVNEEKNQQPKQAKQAIQTRWQEQGPVVTKLIKYPSSRLCAGVGVRPAFRLELNHSRF